MAVMVVFTRSAVNEYVETNQLRLNLGYCLVVPSTFIVIEVSGRSQQDLKYELRNPAETFSCRTELLLFLKSIFLQ